MHKFWRSWRPLKRPRAPVGLKNLVGTSGLCNFASDLSQWVALNAQFQRANRGKLSHRMFKIRERSVPLRRY